MLLDAGQVVALVRVNQLLEERTPGGQRLRQDHALLEVHVVVGRSVDLIYWGNEKGEIEFPVDVKNSDDLGRSALWPNF